MAPTVVELPETVCKALRPHTLRLLIGLALCLCLGMLCLGAVVEYDRRQDAWRQAEQSADNILVALEQDIARNVMLIDLSMRGLMEAMEAPGIETASPILRQHALFDRSASADDLGSVLVLDPSGTVVEDSTAVPPHVLNLGERDYFRVHQASQDAGLYVSQPFDSRLRGGYTISFSRRLPSADGTFHGVVASALKLTFFEHLFEKLQLGQTGSVGIIRADGRMITRFPFNKGDVGRDVRNTRVYTHIPQDGFGHFVADSDEDGQENLYTYRWIRGLPLVLTYRISTAEILSTWRGKAWVASLMLVLLSTSTMALCLLFYRELKRRGTAERSLEAAANKLEALAQTDSMTGLLNRRGFEQRFIEAWDRAIANHTAISVLMLDADSFKSYNDRYGHPKGDQVLRSIAAALLGCVRDQRDIVARYGGEEFVVVLPEAGGAVAARIAERVRAAVEAVGIVHDGSTFGHVTVSVGMAAAFPVAGNEAPLLLKAADDALYCAKRTGRNRVCRADQSIADAPANGSAGASPGPLPGLTPTGLTGAA